MSTRLPSLRRPPIGFAHRGARAHAPENTIEAFNLALRLGATGLESDVCLTRDGQAVLDHDGVVGGWLRRRSIREIDRVDLPGHIPTLAELYEACGTDFELSLDLKHVEADHEVVRIAARAGAADRLWLCHPDAARAPSLRDLAPDLKLVDSTRLRDMQGGPERRAAELAAAGFDAVNLHHREWTGGLIALFHRFELYAFGWDCQHERELDELLDAGIDGVHSDHVDRMRAALDRIS